MRQSKLITISLPATLMRESEKVAKKKFMTRSELVRSAIRHYLEELRMEEAIRIGEEELRNGKAKVLPPGGLVALMRS